MSVIAQPSAAQTVKTGNHSETQPCLVSWSFRFALSGINHLPHGAAPESPHALSSAEGLHTEECFNTTNEAWKTTKSFNDPGSVDFV